MLDILILLGAVIGLAYWEVPILVWTVGLAIVLLGLTFFGTLSFLTLSIFWLLFLFAASFANLKNLRLRFFTIPLMHRIKEHLPSISRTEREAIEAGHVWWEKELFRGRPNWKPFLAQKLSKLTEEEQAFLDNQVETLCNMLDDWKIVNDQHDLSREVWDYIKKERFFGMVIPKEYGGRGFSALAHSTVVLKISTRSSSAAVDVMVPNSLGPGELLHYYGTDEQKNYYLPRLAGGEEIPCFALTGAEAGSDAGAMTDFGVVCKGQHNGKTVLGIKINWDKRYITLAPIATVLGLAFKLYDPDHLLGKVKEIGITVCLIPTNHPGVEIGKRHYPLHLAFMNGPTRGKDVFIPLDWIIGGVSMAGQGWRMLMECLSIGRSISLPALSTACAKSTYRRTGAYARLRRQFNIAISSFEGVEEALGRIAGRTYMMDATRILTCSAVDLKVKPAITSAIAKYHLTEMGRRVIEDAMDVHGGHAIQTGPHNFLAHAHFAIPMSITVEGANILTRGLIIFGQGAIRCHPYAYQETLTLLAPESAENTEKLDQLLISHIGYSISNIARCVWRGITAGKFLFSPVRGPVARYYRQVNRMSSALAMLADITMIILGGGLKRDEHTSARLGDMLSKLYLASAVLKYYQDQGQPKTDLPYVKWCIESCLHDIQTAVYDLLNNYPIFGIGALLHAIIFPFGRAYKKPSDNLSHKIVKMMLTPSEFRDRMTEHCYISKDKDDVTQQLEKAFSQVVLVEPLIKKFQAALRKKIIPQWIPFLEQLKAAVKEGVLTEDEMQTFSQFELLYRDIIKVDEFSFDLNTVETPNYQENL